MIRDARFLASASNLAQCPQAQNIEIACLGRSNVGKSSFINLFLGKKGLAKSSSTPGKTRLINFFEAIYEMDGVLIPFRIVDLPGFGYAKVSKDQKQMWEKNLLEFLQHRHSLKLFIHLIDSRHPHLPIDQEVGVFLQKLCRGDQRVMEIFTKADKLKNQEKSSLLAQHKCLISTTPNEGKITPLDSLRKQVITSALGQ
ncbi:ribosome biogenesis GTP-binding protein YihA/YsxC [Helicobacter pametensis]|uniref:ribosome biogenesis GTP-binding protein YihA/YsxC n=1 Tax=Helicobacter pametensis TaxID=95149 RepID=UPI000482BC91|nr:ribosome biogenesis GTP-binding protein YihA/YsxC [Helicobacter pametensis]